MTEDEQDSVRLSTIDTALAFIDVLPSPEKYQIIQPLFLELVSDKSWRVRHVISEKFTKFQEKLIAHDDQGALIHAFVNLLQDSESEVRTASADQISAFCRFIDADETERVEVIKVHMMPLINSLVRDPNQNVKAAVAKSIMELTPIVGKDFTIDELLPLFLSQLRDDSA